MKVSTLIWPWLYMYSICYMLFVSLIFHLFGYEHLMVIKGAFLIEWLSVSKLRNFPFQRCAFKPLFKLFESCGLLSKICEKIYLSLVFQYLKNYHDELDTIFMLSLVIKTKLLCLSKAACVALFNTLLSRCPSGNPRVHLQQEIEESGFSLDTIDKVALTFNTKATEDIELNIKEIK